MKLITQVDSVYGSGSKARRVARRSLRDVALLAHRYVGLAMASFLLVAGLTGSLLAFYEELDVALNPGLRRVSPPFAGAKLLAPFELTERIQAQLPAGQEHLQAQLDLRADEAVQFWIEASQGEWKEMFADPYTGAILGARDWGVISLAPLYVMPFLYRLHYSLALDEVGAVLFGIVALLWTIDCFIGAYITLPPRARPGGAPGQKPWLRRWLPAWLVRASTLFGAVFTWHRASGLWVWAMLLVFAWSAVALNLPGFYNPVMRATVGMETIGHDALAELAPPYAKPKLTLNEAHARARALMATEARARGFTVERELSIGYAADHGAFWYRVASSLDISEKKPRTQLYFDGADGRLMSFEAPTGIDAGNTLTSWIVALHFGSVGGPAYRVFVSGMGVAIALLSVSGVWIWLRKRRKSPVAPYG